MQLVGWYRLRWTIEQVFRTMKTDGVDVETSQITTPGSLLKLVVIALIAAIRVMQLVIGRDGSTGQGLSEIVADPIGAAGVAGNQCLTGGADRETAQPVRPQLRWRGPPGSPLGSADGLATHRRDTSRRAPRPWHRELERLDPMVAGWRSWPIVPHFPELPCSPQGEGESFPVSPVFPVSLALKNYPPRNSRIQVL